MPRRPMPARAPVRAGGRADESALNCGAPGKGESGTLSESAGKILEKQSHFR